MTLKRKTQLKRKAQLTRKRLKRKPFKKTNPRAILAQRKALKNKLS